VVVIVLNSVESFGLADHLPAVAQPAPARIAASSCVRMIRFSSHRAHGG
jgi:hypothetical protein